MKLLARFVARTASAVAIATACAALAQAQDFPNRPIKVIVPYGPGGVDLQVRALAPTLSQMIGQQIVVENRDGGGATIGTRAVKQSPADGYTLLYTGTSAIAVVPHMRKGVGYGIDDFAPIGNATGTPLVVAVRTDAPYRTLDELIAFARANPGKVNMGTAGPGTSTHISGEAFQIAANIQFTHVPYKGIGAAVQGILGGFADVAFCVPGVVSPHIPTGKMRVLASMGTQRTEFYPDAPTLVEKGFEVTEITRFGFFAPRDTPAAIQQKLADAVAQAVKSPDFRDRMRKSDTSVLYLTPSELRAAVEKESAFWAKALQNPRFASLIE